MCISFSCNLYQAPKENFPYEIIQSLQIFEDKDLNESLSKDTLVLIHFDKLTCMTCVNMHVKSMKPWFKKYRDKIGFLAVVNDFDPTFFRNLRRIGGVEYPILIEEQVQLHEGFYVSLYDMESSNLIIRQNLDINSSPALEKFEKLINKFFKET